MLLFNKNTPKIILFYSSDTQDLENGDAKRFKSDDLALNSVINSVTEVGSMTPVHDFEELLKLGFQFSAVTVQLEKVILELIRDTFSEQMNEKIMTCIKSYRNESLKRHHAANFNNFMLELKQHMIKEKKDNLWNKFKEDNFTLITVMEDDSSMVNSEEAAQYLSSDKSKSDTTNDVNDEDLLDDL